LYLAGTAADWAMTQSNGMDVYVNDRLHRTVKTVGIDSVNYYNASTYATTHSSFDLYA
jgi:hypothetical protein